MTSTNVFSGNFADKPSSRVLKPPGGGNSNIFGPSEEPAKTAHHAAEKGSQPIEQPASQTSSADPEAARKQSEAKAKSNPPMPDTRSYKNKLQGSYNPITGEPLVRGNEREAVLETKQANTGPARQPPGGASTKLW